ncbi:MAG: amidohydrolase family protein [Bryobacteraceae bacterium]
MTRRTFVQAAASASLAASPLPIIDTHIHLFDPARPGGIPWPPKENATLYKPALPPRLRRIAEPLGVVGAIHIECSPVLEDNQWVLDTAEKDTFIVGMIGNLDAGRPEFPRHLERFRRNALFLGIRYGNLWGYDLSRELSNPEFISNMRALSDSGLTLDTANQNLPLLLAVARLTDKVPRLRVVIDHLAQFQPPDGADAHREFDSTLRELAKRPNVYVKVSEVLRRVKGRVPEDLSFYRSTLDRLWELFGESRLIYGSDWPNSDQWAAYPRVLRLVREYFDGKGPSSAEKCFWRNSIAAYRWGKRDPAQPAA